MSHTVNSTIKLYDNDAYAVKFEAEVVSVNKKDDNTIDIVLDKTLFFPEEGGQNSDVGTISICDYVYNVIHVRIEQNDGEEIIYHTVTSLECDGMDVTELLGEKAIGEIDWLDRYDKMQNHSGEHILSGLIHNKYGYDNVGFHLGKEVFTMDLNGTFSKEEVSEIESIANSIVYENVPITAQYFEGNELDNMVFRSKKQFDTAVRIVEVGEYDSCACCAPHVRNTGEIGIVKIIKAENWKGGTRFTVLCGSRAYKDYARKHMMLQEMSAKFSTSEDKLKDIIDNMQKSLLKAEYELGQYATESIYKELISTLSEQKQIVIFTNVTNAQAIRTAVDRAMNERTDCIFGVLCGDDITGYRYLIGSRDKDVKAEMSDVLKNLNAKGGGNADMLQGMIKSSKNEIEKIFFL
jgi:alanyl-tRNA synthetase